VGNFPEPVPSIDVALRTAAESQGSEIISIHLSGMGADGVAGASQVRNRAGDVWVQDPSEAEFPAIPIAIQQAGLADRVIRSEQIASAILQLWSR
jgi:chemotaxis response regulator CheB